jgi:hypothetical protein
MNHGKFWMTTIGAGLAIAGMMTASHAAMRSSTFLFLAGQLKVAAGYTESGMQLMNEAASRRDTEEDKVYAAEKQAAKPAEVCVEKAPAKPMAHLAALKSKAVSLPQPAAPVAVLAKLEVPTPAFAPTVLPSFSIDPTAYRYLSGAQRQQIQQAQADFQRVQRESMQELRRAKRVVIRYAPAGPGFNPTDISNVERELPAMLGQMNQ